MTTTGPGTTPGTTLTALPPRPDGDRMWSIITLATFLCVPAWVVEEHLTVIPQGSQGDSPDIARERFGHSYDNPTDQYNEDRGDCYLYTVAAERIAAELPVGPLARAVAADDPKLAALLGWDEIHALAQHIVTHLGGAR